MVIPTVFGGQTALLAGLSILSSPAKDETDPPRYLDPRQLLTKTISLVVPWSGRPRSPVQSWALAVNSRLSKVSYSSYGLFRDNRVYCWGITRLEITESPVTVTPYNSAAGISNRDNTLFNHPFVSSPIYSGVVVECNRHGTKEIIVILPRPMQLFRHESTSGMYRDPIRIASNRTRG